MLELTLREVYYRAGIGYGESDLETDMKFLSWIGNRSYRLIDVSNRDAQAPKAQADGIEILILKEENYVCQS